mmetsp:Transcript_33070/g.63904  ORF Transcript_33070/g.63904 Transcript_33070/m.63904 type:complete len:158 (+) Transcript_33070:162-635(+)
MLSKPHLSKDASQVDFSTLLLLCRLLRWCLVFCLKCWGFGDIDDKRTRSHANNITCKPPEELVHRQKGPSSQFRLLDVAPAEMQLGLVPVPAQFSALPKPRKDPKDLPLEQAQVQAQVPLRKGLQPQLELELGLEPGPLTPPEGVQNQNHHQGVELD